MSEVLRPGFKVFQLPNSCSIVVTYSASKPIVIDSTAVLNRSLKDDGQSASARQQLEFMVNNNPILRLIKAGYITLCGSLAW